MCVCVCVFVFAAFVLEDQVRSSGPKFEFSCRDTALVERWVGAFSGLAAMGKPGEQRLLCPRKHSCVCMCVSVPSLQLPLPSWSQRSLCDPTPSGLKWVRPPPILATPFRSPSSLAIPSRSVCLLLMISVVAHPCCAATLSSDIDLVTSKLQAADEENDKLRRAIKVLKKVRESLNESHLAVGSMNSSRVWT